MADFYVRSTDGSDADNGTTWALAKATVAGALAIAAAGDRIFVSQAHAESQASAIAWTAPGTLALPNQILCVNDAAAPPTALATTATVMTTGASNILIDGHMYVYGITFSAGSGVSIASISLGNSTADHRQEYKDCNFIIAGDNAGGRINAAASTSTVSCQHIWWNCGVKFAHASQFFNPKSTFFWNGGSILSGGASPTALLQTNGSSGRMGRVEVSSLDLSNGAAGIVLLLSPESGTCFFRNCKLPVSWSGSLVSGISGATGFRAVMHNCDSGDTNYRLWEEDIFGSIKHETTIVRSSGASDGTTPISWKMASSASATYPAGVLYSPEFVIWNDTSGSSKTITVEVVHDSVTALTDAEVWLEVQYLGTNGFPLGAFINDAKASVLAAAANQTASSATWTTTGLTNPNKQSLAVTITPQEKGLFICRVALARASYTVYVDPLATVS